MGTPSKTGRKSHHFPVSCHPWPLSLPDGRTLVFQKNIQIKQRQHYILSYLCMEICIRVCAIALLHIPELHYSGFICPWLLQSERGLNVWGDRVGIHLQHVCLQPWEMRLTLFTSTFLLSLGVNCNSVMNETHFSQETKLECLHWNLTLPPTKALHWNSYTPGQLALPS